MRIFIRSLTLALLVCVSLLADFSYTESFKLTGGSLAGAMKFFGGGRMDSLTNVSISGDKMARINEREGQIIDLGAETITNIDFKKKEYSVTTFAQMKEALEQAQAKMQAEMAKAKKKNPDAGDVKMTFNVDVKDPGRTATVGGYDAKEMIMIITANIEDSKQGGAAAMNMATNMWLSPGVKGHGELLDFYKRMAVKLDWNPSSAMLQGLQQGFQMGESMAKMQEEMAKLDGMPVKQVMRMGGTAQGLEAVAEEDQTKVAEANEKSSTKEALKGLGGALGGFGGFGRKKKDKEPEPPADGGAMKASQAGVLMEITTEDSNFSTAAAPSDKFQPPSGFKLVESDMAKQLRKN